MNFDCGLFCLLLASIFIGLPSISAIFWGKKADEFVLVHCQNSHASYASGLYIAMEYRKLGQKVLLLTYLPESVTKSKTQEQEIETFFQIFGSLLSPLYNLEKNTLLFYSKKDSLSVQAKEKWINNYFTEDKLLEFLPISKYVTAFITCPGGNVSEKLKNTYFQCPNVEIDKFRKQKFLEFPEMKNRSFLSPGIYVYNSSVLDHVIKRESIKFSQFKSVVESHTNAGFPFYFSNFEYPAMNISSEGLYDLTIIAMIYKYIEQINAINIDLDDESPILIAIKDPGPDFFVNLFGDELEFFDKKILELNDPNMIIPIEEFTSSLLPKVQSIVYKYVYKKENERKKNIQILLHNVTSASEIIWAIKKSKDFVGCSDDDLFSKVISMKKIPSYYAPKTREIFNCRWNYFINKNNLGTIVSIFNSFPTHKCKKLHYALLEICPYVLALEISIFKTDILPVIEKNYSIFDSVSDEISRQQETMKKKKYLKNGVIIVCVLAIAVPVIMYSLY